MEENLESKRTAKYISNCPTLNILPVFFRWKRAGAEGVGQDGEAFNRRIGRASQSEADWAATAMVRLKKVQKVRLLSIRSSLKSPSVRAPIFLKVLSLEQSANESL